jgi:fructosamine-3-kinase
MKTFTKRNINTSALSAEADGLKTLKEIINSAQLKIKLPAVLKIESNQMNLQRIESCKGNHKQFECFGKELAQLHQIENKHCGYDKDNFIGLNPQKNCLSDNWGEFFYTYRLQFQVDMIQDSNIRQAFNQILTDNKEMLINWLNQHCSHFSVLHGDLWSGNVMYDHDNVWLIDPAVYFGDSETDIAMTEMFGGFSPVFYESYQSVKPLSAAYPTKRVIYNLYHYLNHYNLFGLGYLASCRQAFEIINQGLA